LGRETIYNIVIAAAASIYRKKEISQKNYGREFAISTSIFLC